jgi:mono/diheme cytochrome c family protein
LRSKGQTTALFLGLALACLTSSVIARQTSGKGDPEAAKIQNPVASTPESIATGKKTFDANCAACHGKDAKGGIVLSNIEDVGGKQPPDLTDDQWDHGSTDGEIFTVIKKGVGPQFFMTPWDGRITDTEIWSTINYLRSLAKKR